MIAEILGSANVAQVSRPKAVAAIERLVDTPIH